MDKTVYRSKTDWWIWAILALFLIVLTFAKIGGIGWGSFAIQLIGFCMLYFVLIFGVRYEIDGNDLVVYQFFRPKRYPIKKIKEIGHSKGFINGPALSARRLAIKFNDRSVMRSSLPLEIAPVDSKRFIRGLLAVNPDITVAE